MEQEPEVKKVSAKQERARKAIREVRPATSLKRWLVCYNEDFEGSRIYECLARYNSR